MKRSEVNAAIQEAMDLIAAYRFALPPFAHWTPAEWQNKGHECAEIRDNMLGWDVTDYGLGQFDKKGLTLFTIRNGNQQMRDKYPKPYAEKLLVSREGQMCTMHFHWNKSEDIINRGGGILMMQLYNATDDDRLADTEVTVMSDGVQLTVPAGTVLELAPGQSVTLTQRMYHAFWAKPGCGICLIGEVSEVNDDNADNHFYENMGRFPTVEEDEPALRLLCNEYPAAQ